MVGAGWVFCGFGFVFFFLIYWKVNVETVVVWEGGQISLEEI